MNFETEPRLEGNYFVSAYPPFSCWDKEDGTELGRLLGQLHRSTEGKGFGLYVHIPFCVVRCLYCYYLSYAHKSGELIDGYVEALVKELIIWATEARLENRQIHFVYFGGGTPSILSEEQIQRLLGELKKLFPWTAVEEVTFECAPKTISEAKLRRLREVGVTRISMGVQQLNDEVLKRNGRVHLCRDVEHAYEIIQQIGFAVVNLDLMVGLVGESEKSFMESLDQVIAMQPDSVTIYQLEMPRNTPLYHLHEDGKLDDSLPGWETKRARLGRGFARLEEAGYQLRSAYTAVRDPGNQQFVYQDAQYHGADLIGIGASAFSYFGGIHCQNLTSLDSYLQRVHETQLPIDRVYVLSDEERLVREFVLQLKLGRVNRPYFCEKFKTDIFERFAGPIADFERNGLLTRRGDEVSVTRTGILRVDEMLPAFYLPEHQGVPYS